MDLAPYATSLCVQMAVMQPKTSASREMDKKGGISIEMMGQDKS